MERRRRIATYVMALGLLMAGGMLGVGGAKFWLAEKRLVTLQTKCSALNALPPPPPGVTWRKPVPIPSDAYVDEPLTDKDFLPDCETCDPETLQKNSCISELAFNDKGDAVYYDDAAKAWKPAVGVRLEILKLRSEIQRQHKSAKKAWESLTFWSALIAVLFSVPRTWYFLLGRIAEIGAAVRGS